MPRAIRRNINSGGAQAGGGLRESPKIPTTSIAKDTQVLLPAFCLYPKPFIPREMASDAPLATLAILKFLEPRPVAADMQFAATNSLLEFMSHSAAVMEPVLGTAPIEASKIDSKCAAETPTSGAADSVGSNATCAPSELISFERGPSHLKSCRSIFEFMFMRYRMDFNLPNLVTVGAVKTLQRIFDWSAARILFCMQGSSRLVGKERAHFALEQGFGSGIYDAIRKGKNPFFNDPFFKEKEKTPVFPVFPQRFLLFCQLHGCDLSMETALELHAGFEAFYDMLLNFCIGLFRTANSLNAGEYRWNSRQLKQMVQFHDNFKAYLDPFWSASHLGASHTVQYGEFMSVLRYFPSSTSRIRCTGVLSFIQTSAPYSIIDVAQQALVSLLTGRSTSDSVSHALTLLNDASSIGLNPPPDLPIYIAAIQSLCNYGCAFKILLPGSFCSSLADPSIVSFTANPSVSSADDPEAVIDFFCELLQGSSELVHLMTPYSKLECSMFLKRFVASHRVRAAVKRTAIDDTVDQAVLSSLETALDAAASAPLRIRVLEEFIKDPCARLFAKFNHLSTLLSLLNNIAANILLKYQSVTAMIAAFDTEKRIDDEVIAALQRLSATRRLSSAFVVWHSAYAAADLGKQRQMLGERLYVSLHQKYPDSSGAITRKLLVRAAESSTAAEILEALDGTGELHEVLHVDSLGDHSAASSSAASAAFELTFDEDSLPIIAFRALQFAQASKSEAKNIRKAKKDAALQSFMGCVFKKLQCSSYTTVSEFVGDVLEQTRSIDIRKKLSPSANANAYAFMSNLVRVRLRALHKTLSASAARRMNATAEALHSYLAVAQPFDLQDLITRTYHKVIYGELSWAHGSKSRTASSAPESKVDQLCKLISNIAMAAVLKSKTDSNKISCNFPSMCHALKSLGTCCKDAVEHGPAMTIVRVPKQVVEAFASHAAWSAPPILQVPKDHVLPQVKLLEELRNIRAKFPDDCDPIADFLQETDSRIANLEELLELWARFMRGEIFERSPDFPKLLMLLVHHGVETPMAPYAPCLGAGWATLNGKRISLASGICFAALADFDGKLSVDDIAGKSQLPPSLVTQSLCILSEMGLVRHCEGQFYTACLPKAEKLKQKEESRPLDISLEVATSGSQRNQRFKLEPDLCKSCSWDVHPELYVRICFSVFNVLLESTSFMYEWSVVFAVGSKFSFSQVSDVLNDLCHRGIIVNKSGRISLACKDPSLSNSGTACSGPQPVIVISSNSASLLPQLHLTLFCFDEDTDLFADTCTDVRLQHHGSQGGNYTLKVPFSLASSFHVCFSVRSASAVQIMATNDDGAATFILKLDSSSANLMEMGYLTLDVVSESLQRSKTMRGSFLNPETFSDFWLSWGSNRIAFGRGRLANQGESIILELTKSSAALDVSKLHLNATVMPDDPATDWIFYVAPTRPQSRIQSGNRGRSLQLSAPDICSRLTSVLRTIEVVTGGTKAGYPFIELAAEFARSHGCAAATLLQRMMCPVSATPTPSAQTTLGDCCDLCYCEPSVIIFPCCAIKSCGECLLRFAKLEDFLLKVGATPVANHSSSDESHGLSFGDALLQMLASDSVGSTPNAPQLKCPNQRCKKKILSNNFWRHFKRQLQLANDHSDGADCISIDERFVSKAIKSLCAPSALTAPFAMCSQSLPDSVAVCGTYHIADSESTVVHCVQCQKRQSVGQMKLALSVSESDADAPMPDVCSGRIVLDRFGYPEISPVVLSKWFSKQLHCKFDNPKSTSDRMELSKETIASGQYKMCPRCKHGPIEQWACHNLASHVGETVGGWVIDNRCEICRFFSAEASDWPCYDPLASQTAGSYLSVLYKDSKNAVRVLENVLSHISEWAFAISESLAGAVDGILVARSAIISFFIESMSSYNPDALRGDKDYGHDSINAKWSPTDCIAQLSMHCMNIRFAGSNKLPVSPMFNLVNNVVYVVHVVQKHYSDAVEKACKTILGRPDNHILRSVLKSIVPETGGTFSGALKPYRHLMVSSVMYSSATFLLSSGIFPPEYLTHCVTRGYRHKLRRGVRFPEFVSYIEENAQSNTISPLHVLLALSFSLTSEQLAVFADCNDDWGLRAYTETLISRLSSHQSVFQRPRRRRPDVSTVLSDSALKKLIISSLVDPLLLHDGVKSFGSGEIEDDIAHVQGDVQEDDSDNGKDADNEQRHSVSGNSSDGSSRPLFNCTVAYFDEAIDRANRRWKRKWLKKQRAKSSDHPSAASTLLPSTAPSAAVSALPAPWIAIHDSRGRVYYANTQTSETLWARPLPGAPAVPTGLSGSNSESDFSINSGNGGRRRPASSSLPDNRSAEAQAGAASDRANQSATDGEGRTTAESVLSGILDPTTWFRSVASEGVLEKLNPLNWFKERQPAAAADEGTPTAATNAAGAAEACRVLGVAPDFFSPVGSRHSQHSGSGSASESGSESKAGSSSHTSDSSDSTYVSSSDSGSGSSVPDIGRSRRQAATEAWIKEFRESLGDGDSDVVHDDAHGASGEEYDAYYD